jgi:drug/metabolite transporter (DMT)-like permease
LGVTRDLRAWLAFSSVSFFWGTTYLGIRMGLESFPVLALVTIRFLSSGAILLLIAWWRGWKLPQGAELRSHCFQGVLMLGVSSGALTLAETMIPSGLAALIITLSPFWLVGLDAVTGGEKLHAPVLAGLLVGFSGVAILTGPDVLSGANGGNVLKGFLILQLGSLFWNAGSLMQRRRVSEVSAFVGGAVQQFSAGAASLAPALWTGAFDNLHPSNRSYAALAWLIVFGSIVGYNSYIYALQKLPVAVVSLYNYINPIVAVLLGWFFYREPFGAREAAAMAVIFLGVALVRRAHSRRAPEPARR